MAILFKNTSSNKCWYVLVLVIILMPSYFIHSQKYPDWGDDFAQYIYQSQQIHSPSQKYKEVLNVEGYSSSKRSLFFSVLLSIVQPSTDIQSYVSVISVMYIFAAICCFIFLSSQFSLVVSFVTTLCVFYNFLVLRLKSEVVPEFLYIALFLLILYCAFQTKKWISYIIPVLIALLISIRFIGLEMLLAYIVYLFFQKDVPLKNKIKSSIISVVITAAVCLLINMCFLNSVNNHEVSLYGSFVLANVNFQTVIDNIMIYSKYITLFFEQEIPFWMNTIITISVCLFFVIGFLYALIKNRTMIEFAFVFYFLFLFVFPYNGDTIRYLIPIVPVFMYYIVFGLHLILSRIKFRWNTQLIIVGLLIVLFSNSKTIWLAINHNNTNVNPYDLSVLNDFEIVKQKVKSSETIAFGKPFIINLLVDRDAYFLSQKNYNQVFLKANYVLVAKPFVSELYPKIKDIPISKGDTTELTNFYLIKL